METIERIKKEGQEAIKDYHLAPYAVHLSLKLWNDAAISERNKTTQEVIDLFKPLFEIEPKEKNLVQIALKVKEIYAQIERLKIDLKG